MIWLEFVEADRAYKRAREHCRACLDADEELLSALGPQATDYSKVKVQTSGGTAGQLDSYLIRKEAMGLDEKISAAMIAMQAREKIRDATEKELRKSTEPQDRVFVLRFLNRWSYKRISMSLHWSERQVYRMTAKMRRSLQDGS